MKGAPRMQRSRRRLLMAMVSGLGIGVLAPQLRLGAAEPIVTPRQTKGPFYPLRIPLDADNDLVVVKGRSEKAKGEISNVIGRLLDDRGRPVRNARIEIWQCNAFGRGHRIRRW